MSKQKKFRPSLSIRSKLIITFALILLLPTLLVGYSSYTTARDSVQQQIFQDARDNVNVFDSTINNIIVPKTKDIDHFSTTVSPSLYEGEGLNSLMKSLNDYTAFHSDVLSAYVGTQAGQFFLAPKQDLPKDYDPRTRDWYKDAMSKQGAFIITEPYADLSTGKMIVTVAKATADQSAVVGVDISLDNLSEIAKRVKIGKEGYGMVYSKQGAVVVHPTEKLGTNLRDKDGIKEMFQAPSGEYEYDLSGKAKKLIYKTNELTGWKMAGTLYVDEISQAAQPIFSKMLIVVLIAALIGAFVIYFIIRSIANPLVQLVNVSKRISEGDLTQEIETKNNDELSIVGKSFNEMTASLRSLLGQVGEISMQLTSLLRN